MKIINKIGSTVKKFGEYLLSERWLDGTGLIVVDYIDERGFIQRRTIVKEDKVILSVRYPDLF